MLSNWRLGVERSLIRYSWGLLDPAAGSHLQVCIHEVFCRSTNLMVDRLFGHSIRRKPSRYPIRHFDTANLCQLCPRARQILADRGPASNSKTQSVKRDSQIVNFSTAHDCTRCDCLMNPSQVRPNKLSILAQYKLWQLSMERPCPIWSFMLWTLIEDAD